MHELPLLIFTLFLQGSVGVTLWLAFSHSALAPGYASRRSLLPAVAGAFVLACLGLMASALHMGYPLNAFNALRHFASSWLSREIVFASLYLAALGLATLLLFTGKSGWKALLMMAAMLGLVDVFCMAQIYMHTSVITWQHFNTLALFIGSVGILGSALVALAYQRVGGVGIAVIVLLVAIRLLIQPIWLADVMAGDEIVTFAHDPLHMFMQLGNMHLLSESLSVLGALLFATGALKRAKGITALGCVMLIAGEVMLRFVFFSIG